MQTRQLPTGTVTLLFTDIEGSTRMLQELGREAYVRALTEHRRLLRDAFTSHGGVEVEMQGDSFHFAFPYARDAVAAAVAGQRALVEHAWESQPIKVRIGLHTGEPMQADGLYAGLDVHHAARIMSAAHGGQTLLSARTAELVTGELDGIPLLDLGQHRLKDLTAPQRLFQAGGGAFPPLNVLPSSQTNLPAQPTSFVGRKEELRELSALLERPEVRLVTLTGPGGTGKTRLALQLAHDRVPTYADGAFACFLAAVRQPDLLLPTVASVLGVQTDAGRSTAEALAEHLSARSMLLVLDNVEHLLDAAAAVADLLAAAPRLSIVATSRAPLRITGEQLYDVRPLSLPETATADPQALRRSEAVELFCVRARAHLPNFGLTTENARAIAAIVHRLDGLPLALELASARLGLLSPDALLARLDRSLPLLSGGPRDADERQRTLRGAIEWSYKLLEEQERTFFRRLSVARGSVTIEAARALAGEEADDELDTLEHLATLHETSLLRRRAGDEAEPRFFMLETIREFACERAEEHGETADLRERHLRHFLDLAERAASELRGHDQQLWLDRLGADHADLRAAIAYAVEAGEADSALRLVAALHRFWDLRGHSSEGCRWADEALRLPGGSAGHRAAALFAAGYNAYSIGDASTSITRLEEALAAFRALGDKYGVAMTLAELAWSRLLHDDPHDSIAEAAVESLALARRLGDRWCEANALQVLAATDEPEQQAERLHEAEAIFRELGDEIYASRVLQNLCMLAMRSGRHEEARELARSALADSRRLGDAVLVAVNLIALGLAELLAGDGSGAAQSLRTGLKTAVEVGNRSLAAEALRTLAAVAAVEGDADRAARLEGVVARLAEESPNALTSIDSSVFDRELFERFLLPVRELAPAAFDRAHGEGRALPFEEAVAYALDEVGALQT